MYLFIYLWLCWVFISVRRLSLVAASGDHSSSRCAGLSLSRPLLLRSTGSRRAGSAIVAHEPSCSAACGIFPDQGSNPCPLHWQADSQPLRPQGSPIIIFFKEAKKEEKKTFSMLDSKGTQQQDRITLIPWFLSLLSEWLLKCFMRLCFKAHQLEAVSTQCGELSSSLASCGPCRVRLSLALLPAIKPSLPCVFSRG